MTSQASMWKLGEVRSNAKGGKFLCMEPLFWQSEAFAENREPRAFSEWQRPSVSFATDHARLCAPAAAALCEAIARRRLDAESQAAAPRALLERWRHVCGPPRRAGSLLVADERHVRVES